MKLEDRICACGCRKSFRCLPASSARYSSLSCMEAAGALPPVEKFGRGGKVGRPAGAKTEDGDVEAEAEGDEIEAPLLMDDDSSMDTLTPPEIESASL